MQSRNVTMSSEEQLLLDELISERFGLHFPAHKREILESRLRPRLEALQLRNFFDYYLYLQCSQAEELQRLARLISNNETYFFRESYQFEALFGSQAAGLAAGSDTLRFLSAGCSSGEEPYTLNVYARRHGLQLGGAKVEIDAFDIDNERLTMAQQANYGRHSLRSMDEEQVQRYFKSGGEPGRFELRSPYRQGVRFSAGNIVDLSSFQAPYPYDAIFCRNVLIYFSEEALHRAIDNFAELLRPGGLLFLGHSESIIGMGKPFETLRLERCLAYRRIPG